MRTDLKGRSQFARPTLVDTIAALQAQQQEQQQQQQEEQQEPVFEPLLRQATTVVMKLLLLYLDLTTEKTKAYGYQLGADLPLCSQFLLCRAVHIHSRDGDEGDDEEDGENNTNPNPPGNIVLEEDGAFILRSTSPSRGQASAAGLMFLLRLAFATAMVHADKTNNPKLKQALWSPAVFSYCQPVRDMA